MWSMSCLDFFFVGIIYLFPVDDDLGCVSSAYIHDLELVNISLYFSFIFIVVYLLNCMFGVVCNRPGIAL